MAAIVVVGGGVAGLACAWHLQQAGHDVEVLEREAELGGRVRSEWRDGFTLERGARFFSSADREVHRIASALGLEPRLRPVARDRLAILREGRFIPVDGSAPRALLGSRLLSWRGKAQLPRLFLELRRRRNLLDPERPERAAPLDGPDADTLLRATAGEEVFARLLAPALSSTFLCPPEELSGAFGLLVVPLVLGRAQQEAFEGGNAALPRALAGSLSVRMRCEAAVVEAGEGGARVRYRAGDAWRCVIADAAVVAVPASSAASLCPGLTEPERAFLERVRCRRGVGVSLLLERPPPGLPDVAVLGFPPAAEHGVAAVTLDHRKPGAAPPGAGLLGVAFHTQASERLAGAPDAAVVERALEALGQTPLGRLEPAGTAVHRWEPLEADFGPGYLRRLADFRAARERTPRLAFAGEYLGGPSVEGALASGLRAAGQLDAELDQKPSA